MDDPLTLEQTAELIARHVLVEEKLFKLTGRWSADSGTTAASTGVAAKSQALFGAESAHHGWRADQWNQRRVRSIGGELADQSHPSEPDPLSGAVEDLLSEDLAPMARLAVWGHVLAPALAARYVGHRAALTPTADGGVDRWLGICITDLNRGSNEVLAALAENGYGSGVEDAAESVGSAFRRIVGG